MKQTIPILLFIFLIISCGSVGNKNQNITSKNLFTYDKGVIINGVKWATRNVDKLGTFSKNPEDTGMFYQWNRNIGWSTTDLMINSNGGKEWDTTVPIGDIWEKFNDPSPSGWRVPTFDEIKKLLDTDKVSNEWTKENGVNGRKFTDLSSGRTLFLPAIGGREYSDGTLVAMNILGAYWSSTQFAYYGNHYSAYYLHFSNDYADLINVYRQNCLSVRCVAE